MTVALHIRYVGCCYDHEVGIPLYDGIRNYPFSHSIARRLAISD
jgi:hypothetical protein